MRTLAVLACTLLACLPSLVQADQADAYMLQHMQPGRAYALNLGSPEQYAWVQAMLARASGKKDATLMGAIERARATASSGAPREVSINAAGPAALSVVQYLSSNGIEATSGLLSAVPGGTSSTAMMVSYFVVGDTNPFASSPHYQEIGKGTHFVETFRARIPAGGRKKAIMASALFLPMTSGAPVPIAMTVTAGPGTTRGQCVTGPGYGRHQSGPVPCPGRGAKCVNDVKNKKDITVCLRDKGGNCNYNIPKGSTTFPFTIAGSITFRAAIDPQLIGGYVLDLQPKEGACPVAADVLGALTAANFSIDPNDPRVLRYCFENASLPASSCFTEGSTLMLALTVYAQVKTAGGTAMATAVVSADPAVISAAPDIVTRVPKIVVTR
jgi:hypothetical protein